MQHVSVVIYSMSAEHWLEQTLNNFRMKVKLTVATKNITTVSIIDETVI